MANTVGSFFTFSPATKARSVEVNNNFSVFRGSLIPVNSDTVTASNKVHNIGTTEYSWKDIYIKSNIYYLSQASAYMPKGAILISSIDSAPSGTLLCNGSSVSRSTYSDLFDAITNGTNTSPCFGYETTTHFNLPDLRGKFIRGVDSGAGNDPDASSRTAQGTNGFTGDTVGSIQNYATGTPNTAIALATSGSHTHNISVGTINTLGSGYWADKTDGLFTATTYFNTNGSHVHTLTTNFSDSRPINLYLNYYICY